MILDLPPMPEDAAPVIIPGLRNWLDRPASRPVPTWITDPGAVESIASGLVEIDDEFMGESR